MSRTALLAAVTLLLTGSSSCGGGSPTTPDLTCGFLTGGPGCGAGLVPKVYVFVQNAGNGNWLSGARVEIVAGANAGLACVTASGHDHGFRDEPGCLLGSLRPTGGPPRLVRVTKPGFRQLTKAVGDGDLPTPGGYLNRGTLEFKLTRKKK